MEFSLCTIRFGPVTNGLKDSPTGSKDLSFAKTPHEAILVHVTCYMASLYVIDFTWALDFGEAQDERGLEPPTSSLRTVGKIS